MELPVQEEKRYPNILELNPILANRWVKWDPLCLPACDGCWNSGGYQRRSSYLKEWVSVYIRNEESIGSGNATMPRLQWGFNREAKKGISKKCIVQLHKVKGRCPNPLFDCSCPLALFIKEVWYVNKEEEQVQFGAEEIVGSYINAKKKQLKSTTKPWISKGS